MLSFLDLCKPKIVLLLTLTALVGMLLTIEFYSNIFSGLGSLLGFAFLAASSAALNQIFDRETDKNMERTKKRPLAKGDITLSQALTFTAVLLFVGSSMLLYFSNLLTLLITTFGFIFYSLVYTIYLKWTTPQNIVIGGLSGALPPLIGWTAITNEISLLPLILVLIIFLWTPPHFWALALYRSGEYAEAKVPMMNEVKGAEHTIFQSKVYCILLFMLGSVPCFWPESGLPLIWAFIAGGLTLWYAASVWAIDPNEPFDSNGRMPKAAKSFFRSLYYLGWMFLLLVLVSVIPPESLGYFGPLSQN